VELATPAHVADPAADLAEVQLEGAHAGEGREGEGVGGRVGLRVVEVREEGGERGERGREGEEEGA
jgi:hypothetical protein